MYLFSGFYGSSNNIKAQKILETSKKRSKKFNILKYGLNIYFRKLTEVEIFMQTALYDIVKYF